MPRHHARQSPPAFCTPVPCSQTVPHLLLVLFPRLRDTESSFALAWSLDLLPDLKLALGLTTGQRQWHRRWSDRSVDAKDEGGCQIVSPLSNGQLQLLQGLLVAWSPLLSYRLPDCCGRHELRCYLCCLVAT